MDEIPVPSQAISDERRTAEILAITNDPMLPWAEKRKLLELIGLPQETIDVLCGEKEKDGDIVPNPWAKIDLGDYPEIPTATNMINNHIAKAFERPLDINVNRASAASGCVRKRWFQRNGYEGTPMGPRAHMVFMFGDFIERISAHLIKEALVGPGKLYSDVDFGDVDGSVMIQGRELKTYKQEVLYADMGGVPITAHSDGFGRRNIDGKYELIEIKSASDYGFDRFKNGEMPDYIRQAHALMMTTKARELGVIGVRFFYTKKNTSHMWDRFYPFNDAIAREVIKGYQAAMADEPPPVPYPPREETFRKKPTGRRVLDWHCSYCAFTKNCHKFELEFKAGKPVYVVKEAKNEEIKAL